MMRYGFGRGLMLLLGLMVIVGGCRGAQAPAASKPSASAPGGAAGAPTDPSERMGGELKIAFPTTDAGDVRSLDPQIDGATYANVITGAIYDSLIYQDPKDNSLKPGLAESWSVSPDGKEYTFKLNRKAKFHDGTP